MIERGKPPGSIFNCDRDSLPYNAMSCSGRAPTAKRQPSHERIDGMFCASCWVSSVDWIAFTLIGTAGFFLLRFSWHDYAVAEKETTFTLAMLLSRLALSVVCSVGAGWLAVVVGKGDSKTSWWLGILMVLIFVPIHYGLWDKFPVWYHLTFLFTLAPIVGFSGRLAQHKG